MSILSDPSCIRQPADVKGIFGSKQLVDILHVHGFCSSYDEVDKIKNGVYIPNGIIPFTSAGCLIQEGSDNIKNDFSSINQHINFVRAGGID
jgi:hypothetical protein